MAQKQCQKKALSSLADILLPGAVMAVCAGIYLTASGYRREARLFPQVIAGITAVLCLLLIIKNCIYQLNTRKIGLEVKKEKDPGSIKRFLYVVGGVLLYPALIIGIGVVPATLIYLSTSMWLLGYKNKKVILLISVVLTAFMYVLFGTILSVKLPFGLLFGGKL